MNRKAALHLCIAVVFLSVGVLSTSKTMLVRSAARGAPRYARYAAFVAPQRALYARNRATHASHVSLCAAMEDSRLSTAKLRLGNARRQSTARLEPVYIMGRTAVSGLPSKQPFLVMGIETSCDDTGVAVVSSDGQLLSNVVLSQYQLHSAYGGVVPGIARDAHAENLDKCIEEALKRANLSSVNDVDAIAVTTGPGLEVCLWVGTHKAKDLAKRYSKPFVGVHHIEAHCLVARLAGEDLTFANASSVQQSAAANAVPTEASAEATFDPKVKFPFLTLVASGGHTQIMLVEGVGQYTILGATLDDALGEAFDKAARLIGLPLNTSGGAAVEKAAKEGIRDRYTLPIPLYRRKNCDFSFAGLKNALRLAIKEHKALKVHKILTKAELNNGPSEEFEQVELPRSEQVHFAAAFQHTAFTSVEDRLEQAMDACEKRGLKVDALVIVGGVAANAELRQRLSQLVDRRRTAAASNHNGSEWRLVFPPPALCMDNGAMIAWSGVEKLLQGVSDDFENVEVQPRWLLADDSQEIEGQQQGVAN